MVGRTNKKELTILSNDPSLTAWGYVVIRDGSILSAGCIKTEAQNKKLRIRKGDDDARRVAEIALRLLKLINRYDVTYILSELPHGSQNSAGAKMIGVVMGIMSTFSVVRKLGLEWYGEADAKKALLGKQSATKREIINQITEEYDIPWTGVKYKDEAIADAMAIYHVARTQSYVILYHND